MKTTKTRLSLFFTLFLLVVQARAQVDFPVSPTSKSFMDMSAFTNPAASGKLPISVPLYNLRDRDLGINIALNYQSDGIRVNDIAGVVGLGWSMNIGGAITRTVRGRPDEKTYGFLQSGSTIDNMSSNDANLQNYLNDAEAHRIDTHPDVFNFYYPGGGGSFVHDYDGNILTVPYQNIRIEGTISTGFIITDTNGIKYYFDIIEETVNSSGNCGWSGTDSAFNQFNSAWYLSKIESPYCNNDIVYTYGDASYEYQWQPSEAFTPAIQRNSCKSRVNTNSKYVTAISTDNYTINFAYDTISRTDLPQAPKLTGIEVSGANNAIVKKYSFLYQELTNTDGGSYFNTYYGGVPAGHGVRLFLTDIIELSADGSDSIPYRNFEYNALKLPSRVSTGVDRWGYYNGNNTNNTYVEKTWVYVKTPPGFENLIQSFGEADKSPDATYAQAGILTRMNYPTGGYTEYTYELNAYDALSRDYTAGKEYALKNYVCEGSDCEMITKSISLLSGGPQSLTQVFEVNVAQDIDFDPLIAGDFCNSHKIEIINDDTEAVLHTVSGSSGDVTSGFTLSLSPGTYRAELQVCDNQVQGLYSAKLDFEYISITNEALNTNLAGGLRIKQVQNCTDGTDCLTRSYTYAHEDGASSGQRLYNLSPLSYNTEHYCDIDCGNPGTDNAIQSLSWAQIFICAGCNPIMTPDLLYISDIKVSSKTGFHTWGLSQISYDRIVVTDEATGTNGSTVIEFTGPDDILQIMTLSGYSYSLLDDLFYEPVSSFTDLEVYLLDIQLGNHVQKGLSIPYSYLYSPESVMPNHTPFIGQVKRTAVYNDADELLSEETTDYRVKFGTFSSFTSNNSSASIPGVSGLSVLKRSGLVQNGVALGYELTKYSIPGIWVYPEETTKTELLDGNQVTTVSDYSYDTQYQSLLSQTTTDSNGREQRTDNFYAFQYSAALPGITSLIDQNRHATPIATVNYLDDNAIGATVTSYTESPAGDPRKDNVFTLQTADPISNYTQEYTGNTITSYLTNNTFDTEIAYEAYSSCSQPKAFLTKDGIRTSVVWAKDTGLILAKAVNASPSQIAVHNFDQYPDLEQPWVTGTLSNDAYSGKFSSQANATYTALPSGDYIVSFWAKGSGTISVNALPGQTVSGDWNYHEFQLSHPGGNVNITLSGSILFDEVKLFPTTAQMTTYTYNDRYLLDGESGTKASFIHYEYDVFGRLRLIKDQDGHTLRQYNYNYK